MRVRRGTRLGFGRRASSDDGGGQPPDPDPPAGFVEDSFTGTAGTNLTAHTGEEGATWTQHSAASVVTTITAQGRIRMGGTPNQVGTGLCYASGVPATAEYDVEADFYVASLPSIIRGGIVGRVDTTANTLYLARYDLTSGQWQLMKGVAGSFTVLDFEAATLTVAQTYAVKLEIRDAAKKMYVDDVEVCSSTDNVITAAGRAGVRVSDNAGSDSTGLQIDNFVARDA